MADELDLAFTSGQAPDDHRAEHQTTRSRAGCWAADAGTHRAVSAVVAWTRSAARAVATRPAHAARSRPAGGAGVSAAWCPIFSSPPISSLFTAFSFLPLLYAAYISVHDWSLIGEPEFIGMRELPAPGRTTRLFWRALSNTLLYAAGTVPTSMAIGLALALGLNRRLARARPPAQHLFPAGCRLRRRHRHHRRLAVQRQLRRGQCDPRTAWRGRIAWLSSPHWALPSLILTTLWLRVGFCMVVYLAALQSIPLKYYEAARIDGAAACTSSATSPCRC